MNWVLKERKVSVAPLGLRALLVPLIRRETRVFSVRLVQLVRKGLLVKWVQKGCRELFFS